MKGLKLRFSYGGTCYEAVVPKIVLDDGAFEGQSKPLNLGILIEEKKQKVWQSRYTGEEQDRFASLAKKGLNDPAAMEKMLRMAEGNQKKCIRFKLRYVLCFRLTFRKGVWSYETKYVLSDVTSLGNQQTVPFETFEGRKKLGICGEGELVYDESRMQLSNRRFSIGDKIEVVTSKTRYNEIKDQPGIAYEESCLELEGYYEEEMNEDDYRSAFLEALKEKGEEYEVFEDMVVEFKKLLATERLFLVCQDAKTRKDFGCGRSQKMCHLAVVKELLINRLMKKEAE